MANAEPSTSQPRPHINSKLTPYVVVCWIFAAFGGLMFGYDIGISGDFHHKVMENENMLLICYI